MIRFDGENGFIKEDDANEIARKEIKNINISPTPLFLPWIHAIPGKPVLVRTIRKEPSYWIVPVIITGICGGFIRILGTGRVLHVGVFYRDPDTIEGPPVITGIDSPEVKARVERMVHRNEGEVRGDPVFIHDGPVGREVWLVEVLRDGKPVRWIFVNQSSTYERPAGQIRDGNSY